MAWWVVLVDGWGIREAGGMREGSGMGGEGSWWGSGNAGLILHADRRVEEAGGESGVLSGEGMPGPGPGFDTFFSRPPREEGRKNRKPQAGMPPHAALPEATAIYGFWLFTAFGCLWPKSQVPTKQVTSKYLGGLGLSGMPLRWVSVGYVCWVGVWARAWEGRDGDG